MPLVQQIVNKAVAFARHRRLLHSKDFDELYSLIARVNAGELRYNAEQALLPVARKAFNEDVSPVVYTNITENEYFNASIFAVRQNCDLPLHDHPSMHGFLKVIYGKVRVSSYTLLTETQRERLMEEWRRISDDQPLRKLFQPLLNRFEEKLVVPVYRHQECTLTVDDPPWMLTPSDYNIHRVSAEGGDAAFFDLLTPPYFPPYRDCHYFRLLQTSQPISFDVQELRRDQSQTLPGGGDEENDSVQRFRAQPAKQDVAFLIEIAPPNSYFCETYPYHGRPPVLPIDGTVSLEAASST